MSDATITRPKKRRRIAWWIGGVFLALFLTFIYQLIRPNPPIVVSKETTYITEPLLENGLPDFEAYMRDKMREGVTPKNNAAVLLWKAIEPDELSPEQYEAIATELGIDEPRSPKTALEPLFGKANEMRVLRWLPNPQPTADGTVSEPNYSEVIDATFNAWTSEDLPPLAEWVAANQAPIDLIVEASQRPRFYWPWTPVLHDDVRSLLEMQLPAIRAMREASRALSARANWHVGENRLQEAWQDNLAIYRLSSMHAQRPTVSDQHLAMAMRGITAVHATTVLLSSDRMPKDLAEQIARDVATVPPFSNIANSVDIGERTLGLRAVVNVRSNGLDAINLLSSRPDEPSRFGFVSLDWNAALRNLNDTYDRVAATMRIADYNARQMAFAQLAADMQRNANRTRQPTLRFTGALSRQVRSELVGSIVTTALLPGLTIVSRFEARTNSQTTLIQLAAALAVYRAEHGVFPEKLDDLVPGILANLPVDLYHAKPFTYKRLDKGYLLYTLGENGADDGGSNDELSIFEGRELFGLEPDAEEALRAKIPAGADDISIRIPILPFKLPKPPSPDSATVQ